MISTPLTRLGCALAAAALLGGCSLLSKPQPTVIYLLPGGQFAAANPAPRVDWSLRVTRPKTNAGSESARIAVVPEPDRLSFYKNARWSDPASVMLRDRLIEALRASGRLDRLSSDDDNLRADYVLGGNLRGFQSEYRAGVPEARVSLDAQLIDARSRGLLASRRFEVRRGAKSSAVTDVVQAFGEASDEVARQVRDWVLQQALPAAPAVPTPR
ncbi:ABC-type transport auxiliary lipoprotein family protein [Pseudomonas sp. RIT-PI-AD]|uniref:ABC-type transport auxiliary lipoprotein family protein n=1 Tax=Pseudomonas sp. RIT-PI-AD TaxID=3035294 RepID=UPI0021DB5B8A|nr:ABC-type transport auxiliary lipoprotein family protein [Pseudomonas sp. RIT-PI-AD]